MNEIAYLWRDVVALLGPLLWHSLWTGCLVWAVLLLAVRVFSPEQPEVRYRLFLGALFSWFLLCGAMTFGFLHRGMERDLARAVTGVESFITRVTTEPEPQTVRPPGSATLPPPLPTEQAASSRTIAFPRHTATDAVEMSTARRQPPIVAPPPRPAPIVSYRFYAITSELVQAAGSWLLGLWALGFVFGMVRLAIGALQLRRITQQGQPLDAQLADELRAVIAAAAPGRSIRLGTLDHAHDALTCGSWRPRIWLPKRWLEELPRAALHKVLLHELAHVVRRDVPMNFVERLATRVLWFHPVIWKLTARLRFEREACCDAWVVRHTGDPAGYAELLAEVSERALGNPAPSLALGMASSRRSLTERVERILGGKPLAERHVVRRALISLATAALLLAAVSAYFVVGVLLAPPAKTVVAAPPSSAPGDDKIRLGDILRLQVAGAPAEMLLDGERLVQRDGYLILGPKFDRVHVLGYSLIDAEEQVQSRLAEVLREPAVQLTFYKRNVEMLPPVEGERADQKIAAGAWLYIRVEGTPPEAPIRGLFPVEASGTIPLGPLYGRVYLAQLDPYSAERAIEEHLSSKLTAPRAAVATDYAEVPDESAPSGRRLVAFDNEPVDESGYSASGLRKLQDTVQQLQNSMRELRDGLDRRPPVESPPTDIAPFDQPPVDAEETPTEHVLPPVGGQLDIPAPPEATLAEPLPDLPPAEDIRDETIRTGDVLQLLVDGAPPEAPLSGDRLVQHDGDIVLGPVYGRVKVAGLDTAAAEKAVAEHLGATLRSPHVQLTLVSHGFVYLEQPKATKILPGSKIYIHVDGAEEEVPIRGDFRVESNGNVPLGPLYGRVHVGGLTAVEAEKAITEHLRSILRSPAVSVATEYIEERDPSEPGGVRVIAFDNLRPASVNDTAVEIKQLRQQVQALESAIKDLPSSLDKRAK